jgi:TPR repeat protein
MTRFLIAIASLLTVLAVQPSHAQFGSAQKASTQSDGLTDFERSQLERYRRGCSRGNDMDCGRLRTLEKQARIKREQFKANQKLTAERTAQCNQGDLEACYMLALGQEAKEQWGPKTPLTRESFARTCPETDPYAKGCNRYAYYLFTGQGGPVDKPLALIMHKRSCTGDYAPSCSSVAWIYKNAEGAPKDEITAYEYYEKACTLGSAAACTAAATLAEELGPLVEAPDSLVQFLDACNHGAGDAFGCKRAAEIYADPEAPEFSLAQSALFYEHSCTRGYADGCLEAGLAYDTGKGVPVDDARAFALFDRGCSGFSRDTNDLFDFTHAGNLRTGNQKACARMSEMHLLGEGTPQDIQRALFQSKSACQQLRGPDICEMAADIHFLSTSVSDPDRRRDIMAFKTEACESRDPSIKDCWNHEINKLILKCELDDRRACEFMVGMFEDTKRDCDRRSLNYVVVNACLNTGFLYQKLDPVRDLEAARRYYQKSCDNRNEAGCERLAGLTQ